MAFADCVKIPKIHAVFIRRNAAVMNLHSSISNIGQLDKTEPKLRQFLALEKEAELQLEAVKKENTLLIQLMMSQIDTVSSDAAFTADQTSIRSASLNAINAIGEYRTLLEYKGLVQTLAQQQQAVAPSAEMTDLLRQLLKTQSVLTDIGKSQADSTKRQVEAIAASKGPKPLQPLFTPKGEAQDYLEFRQFSQKFTYFTKDIQDKKDKLQWLLTSVKAEAYESIKGLSLESDNFDVAWSKLEKKYLDKERIQKAIFSEIYKYKNSNPGKNYSNVLKGITHLENHIHELLNVHKLDCHKGAADKQISFIVLENLPGPVHNEVVTLAQTTYPTLKQIFEFIEPATEKVNTISRNCSGYPGSKDSSEVSVGAISNKSGKGRKKRRRKPKVADAGPSTISPVVASEGTTRKVQAGPSKDQPSNSPKKGCRLCGGQHQQRLCDKFPGIEDRKKAFFAKFGMQPCEVCFSAIHKGDCYKNGICSLRFCDKSQPHAIVICPYNIEQTKRLAVKVGTVFSITSKIQRSVALETAVFTAHNRHSISVPSEQRNVSVLCDTGAQKSLVTKECADRLKLKVLREERASLLGYGQKSSSNSLYEIVEVILGRPCGRDKIVFEAMVVKSLNDIYMAGASLFAKRLHKKGIDMADWRFLVAKSDLVTTDCLIGSDFYYSVVDPHTLPKLIVGMWITFTVHHKAMLCGRIPGSGKALDPHNVNNVTILQVHSDEQVAILGEDEVVEEVNAFDIAKQLVSYESLGIRLTSREEDDRAALAGFNSRLRYDEDGKPEVGFPWVHDTPPSQEDLESNCDVVRSRFDSVMRSLDKNTIKRDQYEAVHKQEAQNGFIEPVPENVLNDPLIPKHFINHFPVYKNDPNATTKCRRVFDASLHKKGKSSLNDMMLKGGIMTPHILEVCLRLRILQYLLTADISKAFMRLGLRESDRNYTLFYVRKDWKDAGSPVQVWRFKSVLFGATSSPFLLNCTVRDILEKHNYPEALEVFVDNLFTTLNDKSNILQAVTRLTEIFHEVGMPLHEFACNVPQVNQTLKARGILTDSTLLKVLGMKWDFESDVWFIVGPKFEVIHVTKRSILSDIARIFDPCGFLGPIVILGRLLVQLAWESDLSWDDELPRDMVEQWLAVVKALQDAFTIPIPRWIGIQDLSDVSIHCFTDASEVSLGVVIYLVGGGRSVLFASKARVCPIQQAHFTIPRKELCAFSLGARFVKFVVDKVSKYFHPASVHLWSDSTTTLQWVVSRKSHKELFIRARVDEIVSKIDEYSIKTHFILGSQNPADLLTKQSEDPLRSSLWRQGPEVLAHPEQWREYVVPKAKLDAIPIYCGTVCDQIGYEDDLPDVSTFDDLRELYTATARCSIGASTAVLPCHFATAEIKWIKNVQRKYYSDAYEFLCQLGGIPFKSVEGKVLVRSQKLNAPPICHSLHLCLDSEGLIRVQTSLANAPNLSYDQKFPLLLPVKDPFTLLLVKYSHVGVGHMGLNYTRAHLRRRFWIPHVTCAIKKCLSQCEVCKVERGKRYHVPDSPALPDFRFNVEEPWSVTAVDMTGHEWVAEKEKQVSKVYFLFFVCVSTGCGHVEMVPDASSSSFANAFDRFTSRRGVPHMLISDHGSNFKGYESDLKALAADHALETFLYEKGLLWRFTPIGAPHFNGFVERQIGILKAVMKKAVRNRVLTGDQLLTVACYAESCFNERPLCVMDSDDVDFVPLTPNSLVYGRSLRQFAHTISDIDLNDPDYAGSCKSLNVMARKLKSTLAHVRKVWISEYLNFLAVKDSGRRAQGPATKSRLLPSVGDVVLIKDSKDMKLGRILELVISDDGECRSARIRTKAGGEGCYPVCNLRFLERGESASELRSVPVSDESVSAPTSAVPVPRKNIRVQRRAAARAQGSS